MHMSWCKHVRPSVLVLVCRCMHVCWCMHVGVCRCMHVDVCVDVNVLMHAPWYMRISEKVHF